MLVSRVSGAPPTMHVNAAVRRRDGPITMPDATPSMTPVLSPLVITTVENMLCAGAQNISTLYTAGTVIGPSARLGYGIGTAAGGVMHTSGKPRSTPIICVLANIESSLSAEVDVLAVEFHELGRGRQRVLRREALDLRRDAVDHRVDGAGDDLGVDHFGEHVTAQRRQAIDAEAAVDGLHLEVGGEDRDAAGRHQAHALFRDDVEATVGHAEGEIAIHGDRRRALFLALQHREDERATVGEGHEEHAVAEHR